MTYNRMKTALAILSNCDALTITEDDKKLTIYLFAAIIKSLKEKGLSTKEIDFQYEVVKLATWNDGYFCATVSKLCDTLQPIINMYSDIFDD